MGRYTYESLANDKVKFLQGTQAQLNLYLPNAPSTIPSGMDNAGNTNTFRGNAEEGAFYLTTDTQRLYIGRKVTALPNPNPLNIAIGDIYPEEISQGIATVVDTGELLSAQTGHQARDGDFYYIKSTNVLAVYEDNGDGTGGWQQINSPTGITSFTTSVSNVDLPATTAFSTTAAQVRIHSELGTAGNDSSDLPSTDFWIKAGENITLKPSGNNKVVEISSANSQSTLKVSDTAISATTNKAPVILTDGINADTQVYFIGTNDTTVSSTATNGENRITIAGPYIQGDVITALGSVNSTTASDPAGFNFQIEIKNGEVNSTRSTTATLFDPIITIGETPADIHFRGGKAILDVYTVEEVNNKIANAITDELKNVNALHYMGTVTGASALTALDDGAHVGIGDVYISSSTAIFTWNGESVRTGDLFIATLADNTIPENANGFITTGNIEWQIVPSGDEPLLEGIYNATTSGNPSFGLEDSNIQGDYSTLTGNTKKAKRPLNVTFDNANSTLIAAKATGTADNFVMTLHHTAPSTGSTTAISVTSVTSSSGTDSLGKDVRATFTAIKKITRDAYGHIVSIDGQEITLRHNYINQFTTSHFAENNIGTVLIGAEDVLSMTNSATKGYAKFGSDTLAITAASNNSQLNINMVWNSF